MLEKPHYELRRAAHDVSLSVAQLRSSPTAVDGTQIKLNFHCFSMNEFFVSSAVDVFGVPVQQLPCQHGERDDNGDNDVDLYVRLRRAGQRYHGVQRTQRSLAPRPRDSHFRRIYRYRRSLHQPIRSLQVSNHHIHLTFYSFLYSLV